ncbi:MAG: hypothetical protein KDD58_13180 [Bdellovibrionales bacterium]|nr:hypothetical protein [Bdellovibrionales bacterium]
MKKLIISLAIFALTPIIVEAKISRLSSQNQNTVITEKIKFASMLLGQQIQLKDNSYVNTYPENVDEELDIVIKDLLDGYVNEVREGLEEGVGEYIQLACAKGMC